MHLAKALDFVLSFSQVWDSSRLQFLTPETQTNLLNPVESPQTHLKTFPNAKEPRPVVIWHGLGDQYNSSGIHRTADIFDNLYPGIFVHSVYLDLDPEEDQKKSVFGDANDELETVCEQLASIPELKHGFDLIGFSQGGLFSRALVERCSNVSVHNLITFGSPHLGVSELPLCENPGDWVCRRRNALLKKQVWLDSVQKHVIPAQYFRDPLQYNNYVLHSHFLVNLNNEKPLGFVHSYKENFASLKKLVLFQFTRDTTLVPKESAWFIDYDISGNPIPFEDSKLYAQDLIGLKELHQKNKIDFYKIETDHMVISDLVLEDIGRKYIGTSH